MKHNTFKLIFVLGALFFSSAQAVTIAPSAWEVKYEYEAEFRSFYTWKPDELNADYAAEFHASHLDGLFHSPEYGEQFGVPPELVEGFAGTKHPHILQATAFNKAGDDHLWVKYKAEGTALINETVARAWLGSRRRGTIELPLLRDLNAIYKDDSLQEYKKKDLKKCTDSHYVTPGDFNYFYNPYRDIELCKSLSKAPLAKLTQFKISLLSTLADRNKKMPLRELRGPNGNGKLITVYLIRGYDEPPERGNRTSEEIQKDVEKDLSWAQYVQSAKNLVEKHGFTKMENLGQFREVLGADFNKIKLENPDTVNAFNPWNRLYYNTFVKKEKLNGENVVWVVRSALFNTQNKTGSEALLSFPKFWKEAWENGDVVYFNGHSGGGASLNVTNMMDNLQTHDLDSISYNKRKMQIAVFDGCSSYGHYQDMYVERKPENLHIVSFGLVSLFHLAQTVENVFMDYLFGKDSSVKWVDVLGDIESRQLETHLRFIYDKKDAEELLQWHQQEGNRVNLLLNAWVSN